MPTIDCVCRYAYGGRAAHFACPKGLRKRRVEFASNSRRRDGRCTCVRGHCGNAGDEAKNARRFSHKMCGMLFSRTKAIATSACHFSLLKFLEFDVNALLLVATDKGYFYFVARFVV